MDGHWRKYSLFELLFLWESVLKDGKTGNLAPYPQANLAPTFVVSFARLNPTLVGIMALFSKDECFPPVDFVKVAGLSRVQSMRC